MATEQVAVQFSLYEGKCTSIRWMLYCYFCWYSDSGIHLYLYSPSMMHRRFDHCRYWGRTSLRSLVCGDLYRSLGISRQVRTLLNTTTLCTSGTRFSPVIYRQRFTLTPTQLLDSSLYAIWKYAIAVVVILARGILRKCLIHTVATHHVKVES